MTEAPSVTAGGAASADAPVSLLRQVLEGLPFGAFMIDGNLALQAANSEAARLLELEPAAVAAGRPARDLIAALVARGDYGEGERATAADHLMTQVVTDGVRFTQKTPSGRILGLSCRAVDHAHMVTVEDLTEEYAEREALRRSAQQIRNLLDSSPVAVGEFLDHIRERDDWAEIPVVVLTAKILTEDERKFLAERTMLILSKSAQPIGSLGRALAAIAERGVAPGGRTVPE
jgi:PAS domain-containing protein